MGRQKLKSGFSQVNIVLAAGGKGVPYPKSISSVYTQIVDELNGWTRLSLSGQGLAHTYKNMFHSIWDGRMAGWENKTPRAKDASTRLLVLLLTYVTWTLFVGYVAGRIHPRAARWTTARGAIKLVTTGTDKNGAASLRGQSDDMV